jgi:hypothetical protein
MWRIRVQGSFWLFASLLLFSFLCASSAAMAQETASLDVSAVPEVPVNPLLGPVPPASPLPALPPIRPRTPATIHQKENLKLFLALGAGTYVAAGMDMHETMVVKQTVAHFQENDPLARPFTRLPTPAYYAVGTVLVTGVNWMSLRMARSSRWHRIWWLPQVLAIGGNIYGYTYSERSK